MPRVPVLTQQSGLTALPGPTISSNASPALLGGIASKQMQNAGEDIVRGGVVLNRMEADEQEQANAIRVQDAVNKGRAAKLHLTYDKTDGYSQRRGEGALKGEEGLPLEDEYDGKLSSKFSEIEAGLGNDRQRQLFRQYADQMRTELRGSIQQHVGKEYLAHRASVWDSTMELSRQELGAAWGTPETVGRANKTIRDTVDEMGKALRWEKTQIDAEKVKQMSPGHMIVINSAVDAGNLDYAREYMKQSYNELTPDARLNAAKVLNAGDFEVRGQTNAEKFLEKAKGNTTVALKLARENLSGKDEDAAVQRILARQTEALHQKEVSQRQANEAGWKYFNSGGDMGKMPPTLVAAMDPQALASLRNAAKAQAEGGVKTDLGTYAGLSELSVQNPEGFKATDLTKYADKLSPTDFKHFVDRQNKAGKDESLEVVQFQSQVTTMTQMLGLKGQEAGIFNKKADDALYAEQMTRGRKLTQEERQRVLDRMVLEVKYGKEGEWFRSTGQYYKAEGNKDGKEFQVQFPEEERKKAKAAWMRQGILFPSEEDIDNLVRKKYLMEADKR